eukprot:6698375-Prymnesium_polylepis.1
MNTVAHGECRGAGAWVDGSGEHGAGGVAGQNRWCGWGKGRGFMGGVRRRVRDSGPLTPGADGSRRDGMRERKDRAPRSIEARPEARELPQGGQVKNGNVLDTAEFGGCRMRTELRRLLCWLGFSSRCVTKKRARAERAMSSSAGNSTLTADRFRYM